MGKGMRYFLTFACHGAHLHGDQSGAVDHRHNVFGTRVLEADANRVAAERRKMAQPPYVLDSVGRTVVLGTLKEVCLHRGLC